MTETNVLNIETVNGVIRIQMRKDLAPNHVRQITHLATTGFYDGLSFHRVIDGFMAQGGCPLGTGTSGFREQLDAEFTATPHKRGVCSMARSQQPNSASSQFFIVLADSLFLDNQYTVWGEVIEGMDFVDQIKKHPARDGIVLDPDVMVRVWVDNPDSKPLTEPEPEWQDTTIKVI